MSLRYKRILLIILIYFFIGFVYQLSGEMRLAKKYDQSYLGTFLDPWVYIRSAIFSPLWPVDVYWTFNHL